MITSLNTEQSQPQLTANTVKQDTPTQTAKTLIYQFRDSYTGRVDTLGIAKELYSHEWDSNYVSEVHDDIVAELERLGNPLDVSGFRYDIAKVVENPNASGVQNPFSAESVGMGAQIKHDENLDELIVSQEAKICSEIGYCSDLKTEIIGPLDNEMVKTINALNDQQRGHISTALTMAETYVSYKFAGGIGVSASVISNGLINEINNIIVSPLRVDVQYGDLIIKSSVISMHDGLNVHAPRKESMITILRNKGVNNP